MRGMNVQSTLQRVAPPKFPVCGRLSRRRLGSGFKRAVGFCLVVLELMLGFRHGLNQLLRGRGATNPLLCLPIRLFRLRFSKFELLTHHGICYGRI